MSLVVSRMANGEKSLPREVIRRNSSFGPVGENARKSDQDAIRSRNNRRQAWLECYRTSGTGYRFSADVETDRGVEHVALKDVKRMDVCQAFEISRSGRLSFDYLVVIHSNSMPEAEVARVECMLTNLDTQQTDTLFVLSLVPLRKPFRLGSREIESAFITLPDAGRYELRLVQALGKVDGNCWSRLFVDNAVVTDSRGLSRMTLASVSAEGLVRSKCAVQANQKRS